MVTDSSVLPTTPSRGQGKEERKGRRVHGMENELQILHSTYISRTDLTDRVTVK